MSRFRSIMGNLKDLPEGAKADGSQTVKGEVLFSSNDGSTLCILPNDQNKWPTEGWTPIGVVVVPGTHNRYGDGSCGVISLISMSSRNPPEIGETAIYYPKELEDQSHAVLFSYGLYDTKIDNIFKSTKALTNTRDAIQISSDLTSTGGSIYPYSGTFTSPSNDASTSYSNSGTYPYVSATTGLAGCDFNGIRNTAAIYVKTSSSDQWTVSRLRDTSGDRTPAACSAGRFKTLGTQSFLDIYSDITSVDLNYGTPDSSKPNKGFWYFPALWELSYITPFKYMINKTFNLLKNKYGNICTTLCMEETNYRYGSSTMKNSEYFYEMDTYYAMMMPIVIYGGVCRVRAFLRF